ncbi:TnsA endonuclease N terminal [Bacillus sp. 71mf]|nr:TnsA endonuclease N terminal [Bacillus sp. 71mf]SFT18628.1 TnsA endonuclease N terminal [Bacillus sp. 103mf]
MTTDFLLTVDKGQGVFEVAHTIKMKDKLLEERVLERFKIERENRSLSMLILLSFEIREWKAKHSSKGVQHRAEVLSRINGQ